MRLSRILTIFRKDLFDAIRDARVLMAIIAPLGIGILYGYMFDNTPIQPTAAVVYSSPDPTVLVERLRDVAGDAVALTFKSVADVDAVRQAVGDEQADIGLVIPAGFDVAVQEGEQPPLTVMLPESPSFGGDYLAASIDPTLRRMAGQQPVAAVQAQTVPTGAGTTSVPVFNRIGPRSYFVIAAVMMLVAMIAMLALPIILAEETEKKTLDALGLIASYADVVAGKSLVGISYIAISVGLLLSVTRLLPANLPLFIAGLALFSSALIGFGLLIGGLFRSANQLNTWGGLLLIPVIAPAFIVGLGLPKVVETAIWLLPSAQATRVIINAVSGEAIFPNVWAAFVVIAGWMAAAYMLLLWRLSRRES